eukprot:CAMPEP_0198308920 /NCGR_PEP_ID=MMETSP1450-20131203/1421_1 /TAXON_ID=753684 ORGANISM="Madagascaria erythrocladiodes, Strain CCMP3234" /NCGR_SAMPLE_ID=MMETSP1450 /ASSEMBLY_ACC=CAM_ASM_001115 /LENGTH=184 /DNA_ID=CAMNT_0044011637 /DNA_START=42 /DNA_END=596 /DNA_ORIENTATION=-
MDDETPALSPKSARLVSVISLVYSVCYAVIMFTVGFVLIGVQGETLMMSCTKDIFSLLLVYLVVSTLMLVVGTVLTIYVILTTPVDETPGGNPVAGTTEANDRASRINAPLAVINVLFMLSLVVAMSVFVWGEESPVCMSTNAFQYMKVILIFMYISLPCVFCVCVKTAMSAASKLMSSTVTNA